MKKCGSVGVARGHAQRMGKGEGRGSTEVALDGASTTGRPTIPPGGTYRAQAGVADVRQGLTPRIQPATVSGPIAGAGPARCLQKPEFACRCEQCGREFTSENADAWICPKCDALYQAAIKQTNTMPPPDCDGPYTQIYCEEKYGMRKGPSGRLEDI